MNTSTKSGASRSSSGSENPLKPRQESARLADWQRQPRSEETWSPVQNAKERNKTLIAKLGDLMDKIDGRDMYAAARPANH